jgi:hypothetical protein
LKKREFLCLDDTLKADLTANVRVDGMAADGIATASAADSAAATAATTTT